jgi:hypothetical protein
MQSARRRDSAVTRNDTQPQITFSVEMAPAQKLRLTVRVKGNEFPLDITPAQAAELGRALLAASFAATLPDPLPAGTLIKTCEFPVLDWGVGTSKGTGAPILGLRLAGGAELVFALEPSAAQACAKSLAEEGEKLLGTVQQLHSFQFN